MKRPAPSEANCSPCCKSASSTTCRVSAVTTGITSTTWAITMAWKVNIQPRKPSGPERDSSKYTTKPTTTDGKASKVFSTVNTMCRPGKPDTPSHAPTSRPTPQPIRQALALTPNDRPTMVHSAGSKEVTRCSAARTLSAKVFTEIRRAGKLRLREKLVMLNPAPTSTHRG